MKALTLLLAISSTAVFLGNPADIDEIESKYGVNLEKNMLSYSVTAYVHDSHKEIANFPISSSPAEIDKQLEKLREHKLSQLEKTFSIHVGKAGSTIDESAYGRLQLSAHCVPVRAPKLGELYVLEYALLHSEPSQLTGASLRSNGLNIYFLDQKNDFTSSEWGYNGKGKASIFIEPRKGITFGHTLEENLMHQFSHNSEYRMGWNPYEPWRWPMAKQLGWTFVGDPIISDLTFNGYTKRLTKNDASAWLLKSSEGPNYLYKQKSPDLWIRCDKNLAPLDDAGKPVAETKARKLSSEKIREFALIKPATQDFSTPPEVFAEALALFRADRESRAELHQISPVLYGLIKTHDQKELDTTYGKGVKVRAVDGTVVDPSPGALKEIRELEEGKPA